DHFGSGQGATHNDEPNQIDGGWRATISRPKLFCFNLRAKLNNLPRMKAAEMFDLTNEVAVVIGATGALGGALAEGLAESGPKVAVVGRNAERGEARVASIRSKGGAAGFFSADAVKKESLHAAHL